MFTNLKLDNMCCGDDASPSPFPSQDLPTKDESSEPMNLQAADDLEDGNHDPHIEQIRKLEQRLRNHERLATGLRRNLQLAEEKDRQTNQLLQAATKKANANMESNRMLSAKITELQTNFDDFTDQQARQEIQSLYFDVVQWCFTHFSKAAPGKEKPALFHSPRNQVSSLELIQSEVSNLVGQYLWNSFIVGCGGELNYELRLIEMEVRKNYPKDFARKWKGALSAALASLKEPHIAIQIGQTVYQLDTMFSHCSSTDRHKRASQLHDILWRCVQFKQKLECQEDVYDFWRTPSGLPFKESLMRSPVEGSATKGWVESNLWPGLYKVSSMGQQTIIERELVMTRCQGATLGESMDCALNEEEEVPEDEVEQGAQPLQESSEA